ncbi:MAG: succinylglutamate desuccinylase/aspartoacylase family protein [Halieaceae bacterium]|jgi:hypothetical protein|nr:succinylglutamate desuccinylase/aspartoacylase family protein [Halieaceae bacterium]
MQRLRIIRDPSPDIAGESAEAFLGNLAGPVGLLFSGADATRTRALVTLLHGNEPSGLFALRRYLLERSTPAVNLLCIVASVHAALEAPIFTHRMLPRARDLNRCFRPPFDDEQGRLAEAILAALGEHRPEAVIDMHNTSGSGPSFGVCTHVDRQHDALIAMFTQRLVLSELRLGALMEISDSRCPVVTIEVGGRGDEAAHRLAWEGLKRYAKAERVLAGDMDAGQELERFHAPVRLELRDGVTLGYAPAVLPGRDITLNADIEHHNFGVVRRGTALGWVTREPQSLFRAVDASGRCAVSALVRSESGVLCAAQDLKLFMITTNAAIAESDCLFYAVSGSGGPLAALPPAPRGSTVDASHEATRRMTGEVSDQF